MRRFVVAVLAGAMLATASTGAGAPIPSAAPAAVRCSVSQTAQRKFATQVYHRRRIGKHALWRLDQMRGCARSARAARNMLAVQHREGRERKLRLELAALTPYGPCPGIAGRWAVPCDIIEGEAHGGWTVVNYRGCLGPYQFCGWKVPWPVRTLADKIAHHRLARALWRGGAGCSNWEQTSSAC